MSLLEHKNIRFVPIIHRRLTFAEQARRAALAFRPDVIAVELPATLSNAIAAGIARLPAIHAVCWRELDRPLELYYLPIDPCDALIEASRLALENGLLLEFIDADLPHVTEPYRALPDDLIIDRAGFEPYLGRVLPLLSGAAPDEATLAREAAMASRLNALAERNERVLCVIGLAHFERVKARLEAMDFAMPENARSRILFARPEVKLLRVAAESLIETLGEIPYLTHLYETLRDEHELTGEASFDKLGALQTILKDAQTKYTETYHETIGVTQWKALLQFTRNLAIVRGGLRPDFYELVIGARGAVDGDYGYEVYERARSYPPMAGEIPDGLPELKIRGQRGMIEGVEEKFRMRRRQEPPDLESVRMRFRRRPTHEMKQKWREDFERRKGFGSICSWPPEDERQERFMDFIRKRALQVLTDDRRHVEEFSTQMLDGLDIRETTRNWHSGKLFVHQTPQPRGKVGAVVVIWDDQHLDYMPTWRVTLYAEHQNESDIAFFATPLGDHVVGPRIARTEFGGILSIFPARGVPDVWRAIFSRDFTHCSDVLLAGAIVFSPEKYIAYVADKPPSALLRALAADFKRHIIYMPRAMFSKRRLKQVRRFHILDGHIVRSWARDYIFDED